MKKILLALFTMVVGGAYAQIYEPEGLNMPGAWNDWTNPPSNNLALANPNQTLGGRLVKITQGQPHWQTVFSVAASGADLVGGVYDFKFTSGPSGSTFANGWGGATFGINTLATAHYGGSNASMTISNGKWYTMNWMDVGYMDTQAIFMETSAEPVTLVSSSQLPVNGSIAATDDVVVTVAASASPSAEELIYVRYSTNAFATSSLAVVTFSGTTGTATIPAQAEGATVQYNVFSTTVSNPSQANVDKVTIHSLYNSGSNFYYTVNSTLPDVNITFQVNMNQQAVDPSGVFITGSFNGFSNTAMTGIGGGIYTYMIALPQGAVVQYKFKNGTSGWEGDFGAPCGDGTNRAYTVGSTSASVALVCFNSCSACPASHNIKFSVNMIAESVLGDVYINGNFPSANNWTAPQVMTNEGNGVYSYTTSLGAGNNYEYKFMNGSSYESNLAAPCGNGSNRVITVPATTTTLPVVCFRMCNACPQFYEMTFAVNMANTIVSANGIHLAGGFGTFGFAEWNPAEIALLDPDGNGIYTTTLSLPEGASIQYKFINGNDWGGAEVVPGGCNTSGNRSYIVASHDGIVGDAPICFGECAACVATVSNDSPYTAISTQYNTNANFPNCYAMYGTTVNATNSAQSVDFTGKDTWYKFTAPSSAVSIILSGSSQDDAIALYSRSGNSFQLLASENALSDSTDFERLNYSGLVVGTPYWISVGASSGAVGSAFTLCIQNLMPSGCASTAPVGGFNLCDTYRAAYRGAASQGVTYNFHFNGIGGGASGTTSWSGTNLCVLSNPTLALRYGGNYTASVDVHYAMTDAAGGAEPIDVMGSTSGLCSAITMRAQPSVEVKLTQRCPAVLLRGNWLIGSPIGGDVRVCSTINYTYEFTQIVSCSNGTVVSLTPAVYTTNSASPYLQLGVLQNLPATGAWDVRVRPNFTYGAGTYGPAQRIQVANTSVSAMLSEESIETNERSLPISNDGFAVYPNPSAGEILNVNITDVQSEKINVRILDATGRVVLNNQYSVAGSLNTMIEFAEPLQNGMYMVEYTDKTIVKSQRLVIQH